MREPLTGNDPESRRLVEAARRAADWKRWGTYLPERQWGTVREDYSADGNSWGSFTHDEAAARTPRWGEDGLLGWCDRKCRMGFSVALWNGRDPRLKERLFGLTNREGNHGEDVKELYYYLDATPTHSYCRALYKYPLAAFPYEQLKRENRDRGLTDREFEILETGVFDDDHYADVFVEYAKADPDTTLIRVRVCNRSREPARLALLGRLFFRNTWSWGCEHEGCSPRPEMRWDPGTGAVHTRHHSLGAFSFTAVTGPDVEVPEWLFSENETNRQALYGLKDIVPFKRDAFHRFVVQGETGAVNPGRTGTQCAAVHDLQLGPGEERVLRFRLAPANQPAVGDGIGPHDSVFEIRQEEMRQFYAVHQPARGDEAVQSIYRQAIAGLLWTKQFYHYSVHDWLRGDKAVAEPPQNRGDIRNGDWQHFFSRDVLSMPDKWEYPWFASWDTAFHMIPFATVDPWFARDQLLLFLREWYLHPNGQLPAYEFNFSDVNPPVHAWACLAVYRCLVERGSTDLNFLEQAFHKLLLNFNWWVNRKDAEGRNLFSGGFLGLDNIGPFDRSDPPPGLEALEQADGTAWMAFYCAIMLEIALELARHRPAYDGIASKFFEHFMTIADAMNHLGGGGLWEEDDGFYYDHVRVDGRSRHLPIRSIVGLIPLYAVLQLDDDVLATLPAFRKRMLWFLDNRRDILQTISWRGDGRGNRNHLLSIPTRDRLRRVLTRVFDEKEFLSPFGIRSLSKVHAESPYESRHQGQSHRVAYVPGESDSYLFGGNSNWRGPIWFPVNFLLIECLRAYHGFFGDDFKIELPTGSGTEVNLGEAADELARRLIRLFLPGPDGRPCHGGDPRYREDPHFRDLILFYEYFHADTGRGCGASHQTGWTALVASLLTNL